MLLLAPFMIGKCQAEVKERRPHAPDGIHMKLRQSPRHATVIPPAHGVVRSSCPPAVRKSLSHCKSARQPHEGGFPSGDIGADMVAYGKRGPGAAPFM
jgi:hypothetical protein